MAEQRLGIIMHGVTGRMGTNQHLARSIVAMRDQGGVLLENGDRIVLDPILVGRSEEKLRTLAQEYGVVRWTTDLGAALADPRDRLFFDAGTTQMRAALIERAILAGKDIYTEKPVAENINDALRVATLAQKAGIANGVVQDKLFLPGLIKLRRLRDEGFFGRILAARIDFGYWVFDGFEAPAQRPAWNYQLGQGGGIILDMFCHWRYVLDHTIAPVTGVCCIGRNHIPQRRDDEGESYIADADDGAFAMLELEGNVIAQVASSWATRVRRDDLVTVQVDGTAGSAVAGLQRCWVQSGAETPRPIWNPDEPQSMTFPDQWREVYASESFDNGFKAQWLLFLRHLYDGAPYIYDLMEGVKGVQLADAALKSWRTRRWVEIGAGSWGSLNMAVLHLPSASGQLQAYQTGDAESFSSAPGPFCRIAYAAAHVVADPLAANDPWLTPAIDWERTIAYREYLWSMGLGVAEAMDTAQRGAGLEWDCARELIKRSVSAARAYGDATIASGCGTDHLVSSPGNTLDEIQSAYELQAEFIQAQGGRLILMASRALAASARSPDDYYRLYERLLAQVDEPVIIHWLGPMFDPALAGYWGHSDLDEAMDVCLDVIRSHPHKVQGVKVSLLDKHREIAMRRELPPGVAMLSGDDFNYPELIEGDEEGYSDALLGIFDAIAPAASAALAALTIGQVDTYRKILEPTVALSRHMFEAPTRFYKTGVVLMAYLNGLQDHFVMVGGQQSARSVIHLSELFRLADRAGLFHDPEEASNRMARLLRLYGVSQAQTCL